MPDCHVLRALAVFLVAVAALICGGAAAHAYQIEDVRVVGDGAPTRVTIWTDERLDHSRFLSADDGYALVLAVGGAGWRPEASGGSGMGGVERFEWRDGRLVFRMDRPMMVARALDLPPAGSEPRHRIVLDLETVSPSRFTRAARRQAKALAALDAAPPQVVKASTGAARARRGADDPFVVVIDPGHGGKDPGASAINGGVEKTIVLAAAKTLRDVLEADPRYEARLTRDSDTFIELEDRVTMARDWGADLFISVHADAAGSRSVEGASVYTISQRGEARVDKEARENNWRLPIEDGTNKEVSGILSDLIKRETKTISAEFAERLLPELAKAGPVLRNTHRKAGLYVLLAPDVPAVLLEIGFLTNPRDARRLKTPAEREKIMRAVARAIDAHFDEQERLLAAQ